METTTKYCTHCDREFSSQKALTTHAALNLQTAHWCKRCTRAFPSQTAITAHRHRSAAHHICTKCLARDFETEQQRKAHLQDIHHTCATCENSFANKEELEAHVRVAHLSCEICGQVFHDANSLGMHRDVHQERRVRCFGCAGRFARYSSMVAHLESGGCCCRITREMVKAVVLEFSGREYRMLDQTADKYLCPTCARKSASLSALCQHAERTPGCRHLTSAVGALAQLMEFLKHSMQQGDLS
ncbi:hypothetical protein BDV28DRAFT_130811 [Aspergillus coremiiformis]|uniref:C2H2-type domain-containing protein n=1 Tax=Aspergillus coremiiformis TaxID=138285 RepID=A0A5N6ZCM5_9EURO|nr:hypothetical protein BDV28DRAFT_130811 [Aspergillus coremiiformis]